MSKENVEVVRQMNAVFHQDHVLVPLNTIDTDEVRGWGGWQTFQREQVGPSSRAGEAPMSWEVDFEGFVDVGPDKVLCVASTDPRMAHLTDISDVPDFDRLEIQHFFEVYKALEPGKEVEAATWVNRSAAEREIQACRDRLAAAG